MTRFTREQQPPPQQPVQVTGYPSYPSQFTNGHPTRPPTFSRYGSTYRQSSPNNSVSPTSTSNNGYYPSTNHYGGDGPASSTSYGPASTGIQDNHNGIDHRNHHGRSAYPPNGHRDHEYNRSQAFGPPPPPQTISPYKNGPDADYHRREHDSRRLHHSDSASSNLSSSSAVSNYNLMGSPPPPNRTNMEAPPPRMPFPATSQPASNSEYRGLPHVSNASISPGSGQETTGDGGDGSANGSQQTGGDRKISCLECRSSKVKCSGQAEGGCERCRRIKRQCIFEQHRRGRKPTHVKMHKLEQSVDTIMTALSALQEFKEKKEALREMAEDQGSSEQGSGRKRRSDSDTTEVQNLRSKFAKGRTASGTETKTDGRRGSSSSPRPTLSNRVASGSMEPPSNQGRPTSSSTEDDSITSNAPSLLLTRPEARQSEEMEAEETQELGLPPLSNPLKLLAQASDSTLDRSRVDTITATPVKEEYDEIEDEMAQTDKGEDKGETKGTAVCSSDKKVALKRGASKRGYWDEGLYTSRYDKGPTLDPITCKIMTSEIARDLYGLYMRHLNARITLLDPNLSTFSHTRSHSALLMTSACAIAARFADHIENAEELANKLDNHIQEKLLPAVLLQGYRSVEIAQAFIIMAAYHANTSSLDGDRSWSLLGYGIRIAAELDMNARILSERQRFSSKSAQTPASTTADTPSSVKLAEDDSPMSNEEIYQRKLRNRERTWCNLWLFENSLSTHMGRRSTLGQDPVILAVSAGWHRAQYAIPGDEAIVAIISLRRLQIKNVEFFEHSVLSDASKYNSTNPASSSLRFQLEFYCNSCSADLNAWRAMYLEGEEGQSWRMKNARLYASYARLILNSYALKVTTDRELLEPIYKESYSSAMTYLTLFSERLHSPELVYVHNSAVVTVAYVAVFALRLCSLDQKLYPYINSSMVFDHVRELAKALARSGSVTSWRNGAASSYAPYLSAVLERVEKSINRDAENVDQGYDPASSPLPPLSSQSNRPVEEEFNDADRSERGDSIGGGVGGVGGNQSQSFMMSNGSTRRNSKQPTNPFANQRFVESGIVGGMTLNRPNQITFDPSSLPKFTPEALSFMAGPSGVQASTILDELTNEDLQFGQNFLQDQFMEGSLFSDMSVFLNTTGGTSSFGDQQYSSWSGAQDPAIIR